jgi:solute carrier family 7 (L-type amino acid transporter), member 9/15
MARDNDSAAAQAPLLSDSGSTNYGTANAPADNGASDASAPSGLGAAPDTARGSFSRTLSTATAFSLLISIVIGSGVFTSPGAIDTNSPSPFLALLTWAIGGLLAWSGAATLAELGTAIPGEGGVQPFLAYVFGEVWGFLAAWTWVVAVMPATLAILGIAFAETVLMAVGGAAVRADEDETKWFWIRKAIAITALLLVTAANCISTKVSTQLNTFFVVTKFVSIAAVVVAGIAVVGIQLASPIGEDVGGNDWFERSWFRFRDTRNPDGSVTHWDQLSTWDILGYFSAALYGALWAYSGWDKVGNFDFCQAN